ncbi:YciI family protein [Plantactinospora sp. KBS50]|uniref:YciI family protein n=1 Tax=Plantactinospora sp. KBS50 TaxID=2024580 RepID=UPI000BAAA842|nr:YciI family protein [Plantactinospora sp. KBS50]ASW54027.1 hypothetical protein CIK06_07260 [Plantactinospora sp. KBS50]
MKYVILIHSNPQPWGHPTADFLPESKALPRAERERLNKDFEGALAQLMERGEFVHAEALGAPSTARLFRWRDGDRVVTDGPFAEGKEHFAGFFLIDVESQARAEEVARLFSGPGETVELRPTMTDGADTP